MGWENPALAVTSTIRAQCSVGESGKVSKSGGSSYDDDDGDDDDDDDGDGDGEGEGVPPVPCNGSGVT